MKESCRAEPVEMGKSSKLVVNTAMSEVSPVKSVNKKVDEGLKESNKNVPKQVVNALSELKLNRNKHNESKPEASLDPTQSLEKELAFKSTSHRDKQAKCVIDHKKGKPANLYYDKADESKNSSLDPKFDKLPEHVTPEITFALYRKSADESLGFSLDNDCEIIAISVNSPVFDVLYVGHIITKVNEIAVTSFDHFQQLTSATGILQISAKTQKVTKPRSLGIFFQLRSGYVYKEYDINYDKKLSTGINLIVDADGRYVIKGLSKDSVYNGKLVPGDIVLQADKRDLPNNVKKLRKIIKSVIKSDKSIFIVVQRASCPWNYLKLQRVIKNQNQRSCCEEAFYKITGKDKKQNIVYVECHTEIALPFVFETLDDVEKLLVINGNYLIQFCSEQDHIFFLLFIKTPDGISKIRFEKTVTGKYCLKHNHEEHIKDDMDILIDFIVKEVLKLAFEPNPIDCKNFQKSGHIA